MKKKIAVAGNTQTEILPDYSAKLPSLIAIILIVAAAIAVYANALHNGFVYDDEGQVVRNEWIRDAGHIPDILTSNVWKFEGMESNYYRPLMLLVYMVDYFLFGLHPFGFHLVNILLHACVSVLVFLISAHLFKKSPHDTALPPWALPLSVAVLFALHPIHTEAVTWIAGLPELGFSLCSLLSLYCYIVFRERGSGGAFVVLSVLSYGGALLFKETALTFILILIAYDSIFRSSARPFRFAVYIPYVMVTALYLIIRISALGGFAPVQRYGGLSGWQYLINIPPLFSHYLGKLVLPVNLNAYHVFHPVQSVSDRMAVFGLVVSLAFIVLSWQLIKKDRIAFFGVVLIVVPLLPVLYVSGVGENTFAERYLYLPSFGFLVLLVSAAARLAKKPFRRWLTAGFLIVAVLYSFGTITRNTVWKSNLTLWSDTAAKSPDSVVPQEASGYALLAAGFPDEAIACLEDVVRKKPDFLEAHDNLGLAYLQKGRYDEAIRQFETAAALKPDFIDVRNNLATAYRQKGLPDKEEEQYRIIVSLNPDSFDARNRLGIAYATAGKTDLAVEQFLQALRIKPDDSSVRYNLGTAYESKGMIDKALEQFEAASSLDPNDAEIKRKIQYLYFRKSGRS